MHSGKFEFTELEAFTISNTAAIIDSLASAYNRVADLFAPAADSLEDKIKKAVTKKGYSLDPARARCFVPFGFWPRSSKHQRLQSFFLYCAGFDLVKKVKDKTTASLGVDFGYYFEPPHTSQGGYFYFGVYNWEPKKYQRPYKASLFHDLAVNVKHKERQILTYEKDEIEGLELTYRSTDAQTLLNIYEEYEEHVALPFLAAL